MANTKEIKAHMKSIRDTQKITNAMYLIASPTVSYTHLTLPTNREGESSVGPGLL